MTGSQEVRIEFHKFSLRDYSHSVWKPIKYKTKNKKTNRQIIVFIMKLLLNKCGLWENPQSFLSKLQIYNNKMDTFDLYQVKRHNCLILSIHTQHTHAQTHTKTLDLTWDFPVRSVKSPIQQTDTSHRNPSAYYYSGPALSN